MTDPLGPEFERLDPATQRYVLMRMGARETPEPQPQQASLWSRMVDGAQEALAKVPLPAAAGGTVATAATAAVYLERLAKVQRALTLMVRFAVPAAEAATASGVTVAEMNAMAAGASGVSVIAAGATAGGEGGSLLGPLGILAGVAVGAAIAGGIYLWHRSSNTNTPVVAAAVASSTTTTDESSSLSSSENTSSSGLSSEATSANAGPGLDVGGSYAMIYGTPVGGCGAQLPPATITVTASGTSLSVTLGPQTMQGSVAGDGSFTAKASTSDGTTYSITGTFVTATSPVSIRDAEYTVLHDPAGCGVPFTAQRN